MKLICLFGTRKHSLDAPELMLAWDEYSMDENPEGFSQECKDARKSWGEDLEQWRTIEIEIDEERLRAHFETPTWNGDVKP